MESDFTSRGVVPTWSGLNAAVCLATADGSEEYGKLDLTISLQRAERFGEVAESAEGGGLLNRYRGLNLYRGFESLPLRQLVVPPLWRDCANPANKRDGCAH